MPDDPLSRLADLIEQARRAGIEQPEAMCLATAAPGGAPAARVVLLRGLDQRGLVFYTNARSRKGRELAENPRAALLFHWQPLGRQVRVEGTVAPVDPGEADAYFASRPRESQLGAWASDQSEPIGAREELLDAFATAGDRYAGAPVPRPPHWSGYRVTPDAIEFWEHGEHRLHHRLRFSRSGDGWAQQLLAP